MKNDKPESKKEGGAHLIIGQLNNNFKINIKINEVKVLTSGKNGHRFLMTVVLICKAF